MTMEREGHVASGRVWPIAMAVGLLIVIAVNLVLVIVAIGGADPVAESYESRDR